MPAPSKLDDIARLKAAQYERRQKAQAKARVNNIASPDNAKSVINGSAERQAKWRKANAELNRMRAREGMRKRREKA